MSKYVITDNMTRVPDQGNYNDEQEAINAALTKSESGIMVFVWQVWENDFDLVEIVYDGRIVEHIIGFADGGDFEDLYERVYPDDGRYELGTQ